MSSINGTARPTLVCPRVVGPSVQRRVACLSAVGALILLAVLPGVSASQCEPEFLLKWGTYGSGDGQFNIPFGVDVDAEGNVYVSDYMNNRIQKFTSTGTYLTQWGSAGSGNGQFDHPRGIAIDAAGNVYVADTNNQRIQKFTGTGTYLTQWGSAGSGNGQFNLPEGIATDGAGNVYVADAHNNRVQKFTGTGTYLTQWGSYGSGNGEFDVSLGVTVDDANNVVYVTDYWNQRVQKFTLEGTYLTQWGSYGTGNGQFSRPETLVTDAEGNVYVSDLANSRVQKFTGTGGYLCQWGSYGTGDGQFNCTDGITIDRTGSIFVVDQYNHRIQKFGPSEPTPAAPVLEVEATSEGILILCSVSLEYGSVPFRLYRRIEAEDWCCIAPLLRSEEGIVRHVDTDIQPGIVYEYEIEAIGPSGPAGRWGPIAIQVSAPLSLVLRLLPNPATEAVTVSFALPRTGDVTLRLFDAAGRELGVKHLPACRSGVHTLDGSVRAWSVNNGRPLSAGTYWMRLETPMGTKSERLVILR